MKIAKRILLIALVAILVGAVGFVIWGSIALQPMPEALNALNSNAQVSVSTSPWLEFSPIGKKPTTGFILYPGAKVDARSYAPEAQAIAQKGYLVVIPAMPLNLSFFGGNKAADIIAAHPEIIHWALGGHSLGGVSAASFSNQHLDQVQGLILLASYPAGGDDLSQTGLKVTSIYASEDGLATNDPSLIKPGGHGALLPLGGMDITAGYKGYGLAVLVEILCSALSGGNFLTNVGGPGKPVPTGVSHFFMAINIESFRPIVDFKQHMDDMIALLKRSPLAVGRDEIHVAGEKEFEYAEFNEIHGVPLIKPIVDDLVREGEKIGVPFDCPHVNE